MGYQGKSLECPIEPIGKALLERRKQRPRLIKMFPSLTSDDSLGHLPQIADFTATLNAYPGLPYTVPAHHLGWALSSGGEGFLPRFISRKPRHA
jgi:hypothetical protein